MLKCREKNLSNFVLRKNKCKIMKREQKTETISNVAVERRKTLNQAINFH